MRFVIQRVTSASVVVDGKTVGAIADGFLVLVGIGQGDTEAMADKLVKKTAGLRIFSDADDKINLALSDVGGNLLVISQFTLYADCRKGYRPGFTRAASPEYANELYKYILTKFRETFPDVQAGIFGTDMKVSLVNDGPFTVILDSDEIC